jgi:hypothetical protein
MKTTANTTDSGRKRASILPMKLLRCPNCRCTLVKVTSTPVNTSDRKEQWCRCLPPGCGKPFLAIWD